MSGLVEPDRFRTRIHRWIEEDAARGTLPLKAGAIIDAILYRGELRRGEVEAVVGTGDRQARRIASSLLDLGVVVSESSRAPLRMAFPAALTSRWMPGLFPEKLAN